MVVAVDKASFESLDDKVYTSENGEKINLNDKISRADDDTELKGIGTEFKNVQLLGVQKKKDTSKHDLRFVSVINNKIAQDAADYGYIAVGADNKKSALYTLENYTLDSAPAKNVLSCKRTSNKISGDYGKFSSDTDYKYVTYSINNIGNIYVAVMFYVKDKNGNVFYAPYTNATSTTNVCATDWQALG